MLLIALFVPACGEQASRDDASRPAADEAAGAPAAPTGGTQGASDDDFVPPDDWCGTGRFGPLRPPPPGPIRLRPAPSAPPEEPPGPPADEEPDAAGHDPAWDGPHEIYVPPPNWCGTGVGWGGSAGGWSRPGGVEEELLRRRLKEAERELERLLREAGRRRPATPLGGAAPEESHAGRDGSAPVVVVLEHPDGRTLRVVTDGGPDPVVDRLLRQGWRVKLRLPRDR